MGSFAVEAADGGQVLDLHFGEFAVGAVDLGEDDAGVYEQDALIGAFPELVFEVLECFGGHSVWLLVLAALANSACWSGTAMP